MKRLNSLRRGSPASIAWRGGASAPGRGRIKSLVTRSFGQANNFMRFKNDDVGDNEGWINIQADNALQGASPGVLNIGYTPIVGSGDADFLSQMITFGEDSRGNATASFNFHDLPDKWAITKFLMSQRGIYMAPTVDDQMVGGDVDGDFAFSVDGATWNNNAGEGFYVRFNGNWRKIDTTGIGASAPEAPTDGKVHGKADDDWVPVAVQANPADDGRQYERQGDSWVVANQIKLADILMDADDFVIPVDTETELSILPGDIRYDDHGFISQQDPLRLTADVAGIYRVWAAIPFQPEQGHPNDWYALGMRFYYLEGVQPEALAMENWVNTGNDQPTTVYGHSLINMAAGSHIKITNELSGARSGVGTGTALGNVIFEYLGPLATP